jgi:hypothetical protein
MWKSKYDHYSVMVAIFDAILNIFTNSKRKKWHRLLWDSTHSNEHFDTKKSLLAAKLSWKTLRTVLISNSTQHSKTQCTPKCTANRNYSNKSKRWSSGQSAVNNYVEQERLENAPQPWLAPKIGWTRGDDDDDDDDDGTVWTVISCRDKTQHSKIHYSKWKIIRLL